MKYYIIKSIDLPFYKEWSIYNKWISNNINLLIEKVREDLENEVLFEKVQLTKTDDDYLLINNRPDKWLKIEELEFID